MIRTIALLRNTPTFALALAAVALTASAASAQQTADEWLEHCRRDSGSRVSHCEVRETTVASTGSFTVNARPNGGIRVEGWDRPDVLVRARIQATADTQAEAQRIANEIAIEIAAGRARSDGPRTSGRGQGWSVSFDVFAPRSTNLEAETTNGSISVTDLNSRVDVRTTNGGISLARVGGDVRGRTTNGGLDVTLAGDSWNGSGLDLHTTNGGVTVNLPANYSARLTAETVNGGMSTDFPVTLQGRIGRRLEAELGRGGAPIRVVTTNGPVRLRRI